MKSSDVDAYYVCAVNSRQDRCDVTFNTNVMVVVEVGIVELNTGQGKFCLLDVCEN